MRSSTVWVTLAATTCTLATWCLAAWSPAPAGHAHAGPAHASQPYVAQEAAAQASASPAQPPIPPLTATIWSTALAWSAPPGSAVQAQLMTPQGQKRGEGSASAGPDGRVAITLNASGLTGGPYVRPGDALVLGIQGGAVYTVTVPSPFAVGLDPAADSVEGQAPPDSVLEVVFQDDLAGTLTETVQSDMAGRFRLALAGRADVSSDDSGTVSLRTAAGHRFTHRFHGLTAGLPLGVRQASGMASPGSEIRAVFRLADGSASPPITRTVYDTQAWQAQLPGGGTLAPGMALTVTMTMTALQGVVPDWTLYAEVPALTVDYDKTRKQVFGQGPADRPVVAEVTYRQQVVRRTGTTGPDGRFAIALADVPGLRVGSLVTVKVNLQDGVWVQRAVPVPGIRLGVYGSNFTLVYPPGTAITVITVTLTAPDGKVKWQGAGQVGATGVIDSLLLDPATNGFTTIDPGDQMQIERAAGDPTVLTIPRLTSAVDVAGDRVSGEVLPGADVRVTWLAAFGSDLTLEQRGKADGQGHYDLSFAGLHDLVRGDGGTLEVMTDRVEYVTPWTAARLSVYLGRAYMNGISSVGRTVKLRLETADGKLLATGQGVSVASLLDGRPQGWNISFVSSAGEFVAPRSGDVLKADLGDEVITLPLPELAAVIHVEDDSIVGHTTPGASVTISARKPSVCCPQPQRDVTVNADGSGIFQTQLADFDLGYNDRVLLAVHPDGHDVYQDGTTPGLTIDLNAGTVTGIVEPDVALSAEVQRGGRRIGQAKLRTDLDAKFSTALFDPSGAPIRLATGDVLNLQAPDATTYRQLQVTVPELTMDPVRTPGGVRGRAAPGGSLQVRLETGLPALGRSTNGMRLIIGPGGTYAADFVPATNLVRDDFLTATYFMTVGHQVLLRRALAMSKVELEGLQVCGVADQDRNVVLALADAAGAAKAGGRSKVSADLRYSLALTTPTGIRAMTAAGDRLSASTEDDAWSLDVPALSAQAVWATNRITGTGPAGWRYSVSTYRDHCTADITFWGNQPASSMTANVSPSGTLNASIGSYNIRTRYGVQLVLTNPEGNQVYRQFYRPFGRAWVRTERLEGRADPRTTVTATLQGAAGGVRAVAASTTGDDGWFAARFLDGAGKPVILQPGDFVLLDATTESPRFEVADVNLDFSTASGLDATAPPGQSAWVELELAKGRTFKFERVADAAGRFSYRPADLPPRADWSLADVRRVRVTVENDVGHETVVEARVGGPAGPSTRRVYAPFVGKVAGR